MGSGSIWNVRVLVRLCGVLCAAFAGIPAAHAQAWVEEPGSLNVGIDYNYASSEVLIATDGIEFPNEPIVNHTMTLQAEYVPIDKLAVGASVSLMMLKYAGAVAPHGSYDDGNYHTTIQDFRVEARYQVLDEPLLALSPYICFTVPTHDYETRGYASAGRGLKQVHLGLHAGRTLSPHVPNLFLLAGYEFTLSEKNDATPETEEIGQNRSDLSFLFGYAFLEGRLVSHLGGNMRIAHGGINFEDFGNLPQPVVMNHDALLREEFFLLGGGLSYAITESLQVSAIVRFFVSGANTRDSNLFGLGVSWSAL